MLFETHFPSPVGPSTYNQHEFLDHIFDRDDHRDVPRGYIWSEMDGMLFVRRTIPTDGLPWMPVKVPPVDSVITMHLQARARSTAGDHRKQTIYATAAGERPTVMRGTRQSITEPNEAIAWLERRAGNIGLQIEDVEVEMIVKIIEKPSKLGNTIPISYFDLFGTSFVAVATVIDRQRFETALTDGIGDSKAYGFGFIHFWRRGQHA